MNTLRIGKKRFTGPSCWEEITPRHYLQLLNWRIRLGSNPAGKWTLLRLWYGIRYRHVWRLTDEQRMDLAALLDFVEERPERWMLPAISLRGKAYRGPGDGLEYLNFGEFMHGQAARDRFTSGGTMTDLAELLASLYQPRAFFWQASGENRRRLFDMRRHPDQIRVMAHAPESVSMGILLNFEGCLDRFPDQFPHLFSQHAESAGAGTWLDVGLSLARQTGALGTFAQIEQTNLFLVLTTLDALMKENEELSAKMKPHG